MKFTWIPVPPLWVKRIFFGIFGFTIALFVVLSCTGTFPYGFNSSEALADFKGMHRSLSPVVILQILLFQLNI